MRTWRFGDRVAAEAIIPAPNCRSECWRTPSADRMLAAGFAKGVSADDILFAGHDFAAGSAAERLVGFLDTARIRAIVAKSFNPDFERAAAKSAFAMISLPDAVKAYERGEYAPPDRWLIMFILEAGPDATRRQPYVELDVEKGRLVVDEMAFAFEPSAL